MIQLSTVVSLNDLLFYPYVMAGVPVSTFTTFTQDIEDQINNYPLKSLVVSIVALHVEGLHEGMVAMLISTARPDQVAQANLRVQRADYGYFAKRFSANEVRHEGWVFVLPSRRQLDYVSPKASRVLRATFDPVWSDVWRKSGSKILARMLSLGDLFGDPADISRIVAADVPTPPTA